MLTLAQYAPKYRTVHLRREDGILEMRFHTNSGPWHWARDAMVEMEEVFLDVGRDRANEVIIMAGTGDEFSGPAKRKMGPEDATRGGPDRVTQEYWDPVYWEGKHLLTNLLNIEVPMISAINGPALRHPEVPLLCDVVLASENATIQDSGHFSANNVPGDGVHIVFPLLMGLNRGRFFLLTGQTLSASEAHKWGLVSEVLSPDQLLPRAWEHARKFMLQPQLVRRYTRVLLTQDIKQRMHDLLGYGLALEGMGKM